MIVSLKLAQEPDARYWVIQARLTICAPLLNCNHRYEAANFDHFSEETQAALLDALGPSSISTDAAVVRRKAEAGTARHCCVGLNSTRRRRHLDASGGRSAGAALLVALLETF